MINFGTNKSAVYNINNVSDIVVYQIKNFESQVNKYNQSIMEG